LLPGLERTFDDGVARQDLDRYRQNGPAGTTRMLLEALTVDGVAGLTLLDIGGGVGAIHHELIDRGLAQATDVDASSAYLAASREEGVRRGHEGRTTYVHGDFACIAATVEPADLVTLDRVICCYPDMPALLGPAAERALRSVAIVYPRDRWWMRFGARAATAFRRVTGYGVYVHRSSAVAGILRRAGLEPRHHAQTYWWRVDVWSRPPATPGAAAIPADGS
jgi:magnesium-protoporphyrin O-methyltransferase